MVQAAETEIPTFFDENTEVMTAEEDAAVGSDYNLHVSVAVSHVLDTRQK